MVNQELLSYVRASLSQGATFEIIRNNLKTAGWADADIDEAIKMANNPSLATSYTPPSVVSASSMSDGTVKNKSHKGLILFIVILVFLLASAGGLYAYLKKLGPFDKTPYTEENFISGVAFKAAQIKTTKYSVALDLSMGPRDADAVPFKEILANGEGAPSIGQMMQYFPKEINTKIIVTAQTDLTQDNLTDSNTNIDATGDFEDLSFKFNADLLTKGEDIYFKINNIPSVFLGFFPLARDQWFKFDLDKFNADIDPSLTEEERAKISKDIEDLKAEYKTQMKEAEDSFKKSKEELAKTLKEAMLDADAGKMFTFKNKPIKEEIDGQVLYRYELATRKDKSFNEIVEKAIQEAEKEYPIENAKPEEQEVLKLIKDPNFKNFMVYVLENAHTTVWVDESGFPIIVEQGTRFVPPDSVPELASKQINLSMTLKLSEINEPFTVEAPVGAKDFVETITKSLNDARDKGNNARIKAVMLNIRTYSELYYNENKGSYGKTSINGNCKTQKTLFGYPQIAQSILELEKSTKDVHCFSNSKAWAISAKLIDTADETGYWCVDSLGDSKRLTGPTNGTVCP